MQSNDIHTEMIKRQLKLSGGVLRISFIPADQKYQLFKRAFFDYTCEKLDKSQENDIVVEEIRNVFHRLDSQFTSASEKESFYENYVHSILEEYESVTGKEYLWRINDDPNNSYPRIVDNYLETDQNTSNEDTAIWLFRKLEQTAREKSASTGKKAKAKII